MIYITGDMHGDHGVFAERRLDKLKKGDYLLISGDFGFIWNDSEAEMKTLKKLEKRKYFILFVDGAHENHEKINGFEQVEFCGAQARKITENIYCLRRGEIYTIEGKSVFALGGGLDPYADEDDDAASLPSDEELKYAVDNLQARHKTVDLIVTHEAPASIKRLIDRSASINDLNIFLDTLMHNVRYGEWYFGSLHEDRALSEKLICVYELVHKIG